MDRVVEVIESKCRRCHKVIEKKYRQYGLCGSCHIDKGDQAYLDECSEVCLDENKDRDMEFFGSNNTDMDRFLESEGEDVFDEQHRDYI